NKTFFFASWEQFDLRQAATTTTTVPTVAMRSGNFSAAGIPAIFDPLSGTTTNGVYTRSPFAGNIIPASKINPAAINMMNFLFPLPTNNALSSNYIVNVPRSTDYNQYIDRFDHNINDKDRLFGRFTLWNKNY